MEVRLVACWILGQLNNQQAIERLLNVLNGQEGILTWESAKALVNLASSKTVQPLIDILFNGKNSHNRAAAAYTLGMLADKQAIDSLLRVLNGADTSEVRCHAAEALGHIADDRATMSLIDALGDKSTEVRFWSAFALGEIGNNKAIPELERLVLTDKNELPGWGTVGREAEKAIKQIQDRT